MNFWAYRAHFLTTKPIDSFIFDRFRDVCTYETPATTRQRALLGFYAINASLIIKRSSLCQQLP